MADRDDGSEAVPAAATDGGGTDEDPPDGDAGDDEDGFLADERRSQLRRAGNVLGVLLLLALVLPFVAYAVPQVIGAEYSYVVLSGSMQPALGPGDVTYVDGVEASAVETGDVINFKRAGDTRTTTHRVIEVVERDGEPAFRTEGDNNEDPDQGVVTPDELRGRVMTVGGGLLAVPYLGYLIQFTGTQTGFALLFVVPLTLLVANEIWNVVSSARPDSSADGPDSVDGGDPKADTEGKPETVEAPDGETDSAEPGVSFRPAELRLASLVLGAFVAYSAWIAYADPRPLTIGVAGSATVAFLLVGALYKMGEPTEEGEEAVPGTGGAPARVVVRSGRVPAADDGSPTETVSSLETLVDPAETTDGVIERDPDEGVYHLAVGDTLYVYDPRSGADEGSASETSDQPSAGADHLSSSDPGDSVGDERTSTDVETTSGTEADDD